MIRSIMAMSLGMLLASTVQGRPHEPDPASGNSVRQGQQSCAERADQRRLAGDVRLRFIDRCVDRDRELSDQLMVRHQQCHERARDRGLTGDRRREFVAACFDGYRAYDVAGNRASYRW